METWKGQVLTGVTALNSRVYVLTKVESEKSPGSVAPPTYFHPIDLPSWARVVPEGCGPVPVVVDTGGVVGWVGVVVGVGFGPLPYEGVRGQTFV